MGKYSKAVNSFIAALLIFSMTITLFFFSTTVKADILGPKYYYLSIEKDNIKDFETKYKDAIKQKYLNEYSYECKAKATIGGDIVKSDSSVQEVADFLSKFEFGVNYNVNYKDIKDGYYTALFTTKYDGKPLGNIDIKSADNKTLIAFPELTEKTVGIENSSASTLFYEASLGDDQAFKKLFGISRDTYEDMVEKYIKDVIFKQIPDDNVALNQDAVFEKIKCNSITFKLDKKVVSDIYRAVALEMGSDQDLKTMVFSLSKSLMDSVNIGNESELTPTQEQIDEQIEEMCEELNDEADNMEEVQLEYTAYFNSNDEILARQIKDNTKDVSVTLSAYKNPAGADIFSFLYEEDGKTEFEIANKLKFLNGSIFEGNFDINVSGKSLLEAQYTYDKLGQAGGIDAFVGKLDGKIHTDQFDKDAELSGDSGLSDITFSFSNQKKDNDTLVGNAKISTEVEGKSMEFDFMTEVKQSNTAVSKPQVSLEDSTKVTDYSKLNEIMTEIMDSLKKKLPDVIPEFDTKNNFEDENQDYSTTEAYEF